MLLETAGDGRGPAGVVPGGAEPAETANLPAEAAGQHRLQAGLWHDPGAGGPGTAGRR